MNRPLGVLVFLFLEMVADAGYAQRAPRVLIDGSHEFTFAWSTDWWEGTLGKSYLRPNTFEYTYSWATLDTSIYSYDVVVTYQVTTTIPFPKAEQTLLRNYVSAGGGLLIVGKGWAWDRYAPHRPGDAYPLNGLASQFGFQFTTATAARPYSVNAHEITNGITLFENGSSEAGTLAIPSGAEELVVDGSGQPIAAAHRFGHGRVIAIAENDCVPTTVPLPAAVRNGELMRRAFTWLSAGMIARNTHVSIPQRTYPERSVQLGPLKVEYASALASRVNFIIDTYPFINQKLEEMMGVKNVSTLKVVALATGGGGYSGGEEIGVGVLTNDKAVFGVLAHELIHSFQRPGGEPIWMGEGWATLGAFRVQTAYGFDIQSDRAGYETQFRAVDPDGSQLDLNTSDRSNQPGYPSIVAYMGKCMWVIEGLERGYGTGLMKRYFVLQRKYPQLQGATTDKVVYRLSVAAGVNLFEYFGNIGTTVTARPVLPLVFSTSPEKEAQQASSEGPIVIEFNTEMNPATIGEHSVKVIGGVSGRVQGTIMYTDSTRTLTFTPRRAFTEKETVSVTLLPIITDEMGNPLDGNGNAASDGAADEYVFRFTVGTLTSIEGRTRHDSPESFLLYQNYPNPFNSFTTIKFEVKGDHEAFGMRVARISLRVYDLLGREILTLVEGRYEPGVYRVLFDTARSTERSLSSGTYLYTLEVDQFRDTKRMLLLQ